MVWVAHCEGEIVCQQKEHEQTNEDDVIDSIMSHPDIGHMCIPHQLQIKHIIDKNTVKECRGITSIHDEIQNPVSNTFHVSLR